MEGERLSLSRLISRRDAWLVLDTNASRSSAVVSQRSKTWREGNRNQDTGRTLEPRIGASHQEAWITNGAIPTEPSGKKLLGGTEKWSRKFDWWREKNRKATRQSQCSQSINRSILARGSNTGYTAAGVFSDRSFSLRDLDAGDVLVGAPQ